MHVTRAVRPVIAIEARPLAIGKENVGLAIIVIVDGAYAATAVFNHTEFELRSVLLDVELWISLVFVVNADARQFFFGIEAFKVASIATDTQSFDEFILHDLPVISAGDALVDQIPTIEIAILKDLALTILAVKNELNGELNRLFKLHLFDQVELELDVVDRS